MTVTISTAVRNAKVAAATAMMGAGRIKFLTATDAVVADIALADPAFAAPAAGQSFAIGTLVDPFTASGVVTKFAIENSTGGVLATGTVTTVGLGGDIELAATAYGSGDRLELTGLSYVQPES